MKALTLFLLIFTPVIIEASVQISEVAWMGTAVSANDEWIELYNNGSAVSLDGWELSDGVNLSIDLSGTVGSGQYAVLERTDDDSAPGTAFLIYVGALTNTGSTLTLRDSTGTIINSVAGGENWENIGGNNDNKDTPQLRSSGWVTAVATPGSGIQTTTTPVVSESTSSSGGSSSGIQAKAVPSVAQTLHSSPRLPVLDITSANEGFVHQPISFVVQTTGVSDTIASSMQYVWSFGDLHAGNAEEVSHSYVYPGQYMVTVQGKYKDYEAEVSKIITIKAVPVSLRILNDTLLIINEAPYNISLTGYTLVGEHRLAMPLGMQVLAKETVTVPLVKLGVTASTMITLYDASKTAVASTGGMLPAAVSALPVKTLSIAAPKVVYSTADAVQISNSKPEELTTLTPLAASVIATAEASSDTTLPKQTPGTPWWPYVALLGVMSVGVIALFLPKPLDDSKEDVYN